MFRLGLLITILVGCGAKGSGMSPAYSQKDTAPCEGWAKEMAKSDGPEGYALWRLRIQDRERGFTLEPDGKRKVDTTFEPKNAREHQVNGLLCQALVEWNRPGAVSSEPTYLGCMAEIYKTPAAREARDRRDGAADWKNALAQEGRARFVCEGDKPEHVQAKWAELGKAFIETYKENSSATFVPPAPKRIPVISEAMKPCETFAREMAALPPPTGHKLFAVKLQDAEDGLKLHPELAFDQYAEPSKYKNAGVQCMANVEWQAPSGQQLAFRGCTVLLFGSPAERGTYVAGLNKYAWTNAAIHEGRVRFACNGSLPEHVEPAWVEAGKKFIAANP